jgi:hypothetical protein
MSHLCHLNQLPQPLFLSLRKVPRRRIRQAAHIVLLQLPCPWIQHLRRFLHKNLELSDRPLGIRVLVLVEPPVEPQRTPVAAEMQELGCADGEVGFVAGRQFALLPRGDGKARIEIQVGGVVSRIEVVWVLNYTHYARCAGVEGVGGVAD